MPNHTCVTRKYIVHFFTNKNQRCMTCLQSKTFELKKNRGLSLADECIIALYVSLFF
jgi:hypothetical protein